MHVNNMSISPLRSVSVSVFRPVGCKVSKPQVFKFISTNEPQNRKFASTGFCEIDQTSRKS